jgi:hypothetical protein
VHAAANTDAFHERERALTQLGLISMIRFSPITKPIALTLVENNKCQQLDVTSSRE